MANQIPLSSNALDLGAGATVPAVNDLQAYLSRFGWLRLPGQEPLVADHDQLPRPPPARSTMPQGRPWRTSSACADCR